MTDSDSGPIYMYMPPIVTKDDYVHFVKSRIERIGYSKREKRIEGVIPIQ